MKKYLFEICFGSALGLMVLFSAASCGDKKEPKKETACTHCACHDCNCDLDGKCDCGVCACHEKKKKPVTDPDSNSGGCHGDHCG